METAYLCQYVLLVIILEEKKCASIQILMYEQYM